MASTVTGIYESAEQMRNAKEDQMAAGIPREQIYVDEPACKLRVMTPATTRVGIAELLERHGLKVLAPQTTGQAG